MVFFTALLMGLVCGFVLAGDHERFFTLRLGLVRGAAALKGRLGCGGRLETHPRMWMPAPRNAGERSRPGRTGPRHEPWGDER